MQTRNSTGSTPLHVAAYYGSREMINMLLECGAGQTERNKVTSLPDMISVSDSIFSLGGSLGITPPAGANLLMPKFLLVSNQDLLL